MPDDARPKAALFQKGARTEIGKRIEEAVHAGRSMDVARHQTEADPSEVAGNPSINQG